jgi:hypothetical protein
MNNFWKRLKFYGFGFGMGILIIYAMFGTRSCISPNEHKMQELVFQNFLLSQTAKCKLNCLHLNEFLLKIQLRHFEVNYDLSTVHKSPCGEYFIQPKKEFVNRYNFKFVALDCDTITRINDITIVTNNTCTCK